MNTIVLTGGGTGGHVIPALALVPYLRKYFSNIYFAGEAGGVEETLAAKYGLPFLGAETIKFDRRRLLRNLAVPRVLHRSAEVMAAKLGEIGCGIVFSKGGYCALPTVLAAHRLGLPIVCHESDRTLGLANRLTLHYTDHLVTSFADTPKGTCIGNPIRDEILRGDEGRVALPMPQAPALLVVGGSMGAAFLNRTAAELAERMTGWNVVNVYGKTPVPCACVNYVGIPFTDRIADYYARCDVVLCRAGANTMFELAALGKPTVAVPLPKGTSRGDQVANAAYFAARYAHITAIPQEKATTETLVKAIEDKAGIRGRKRETSWGGGLPTDEEGRSGAKPAYASPNAAIARYVYDVFLGSI